MKCKIVLTSVLWTPDYQNARRFGSRAEQEQYFCVGTLFTDAVPERNIDAGSFTRLTIKVKTGQAGIGDIMSANYAIIKDATNSTSPKYWYYFITNSSFDSVDQTTLTLEMDVIQSYYIDMTFGEGIIERAHLNRWNASGKFSRLISSPFYVRDEIRDLPKRIKSTTSCTTSPWQPSNARTTWLNTYVDGWIYAYLDVGTYTYDGESSSVAMLYDKDPGTGSPLEMQSPYFVVCCPIYSSSAASIKINGKALTLASFFEFINANMAHVYNIKVSQFSPFCRSKAPTATVNGTSLEIDTNNNVTTIGTSKYIGIVTRQFLKTQYISKDYTIPQASIEKSGIDTYAEDLGANPKIFNSDYRELKIVYAGGEYRFDIQKIFGSTSAISTSVTFVGFELLTAEIAPTFISILPNTLEEAVYPATAQNRIGYMAENDLTIPFSKNQLDVFLANNKNFFQQKQASYTFQRAQAMLSSFKNIISSGAGVAGGVVSGDIAGAVKQGAGAILGVGESIFSNEMSIYYDEQTTKYTLDNMASGVDALANSNSNAYFTLALTDVKILLQELEGLPVDVNRALEDMHKNGYTYNRMGYIKDFENIRSKWNYIKANVEIIKTPVKIPNEVRSAIKAIFARGIRFWNTDNWSFEQINLENEA